MCSIGPHKYLLLFSNSFVLLIAWFFSTLIIDTYEYYPKIAIVNAVLVFINVLAFFATVLGDSGVPDEVFLSYFPRNDIEQI